MVLMRELEENGYITITEQKGLPNGLEPDKDFVWLVQSELGAYFESCLDEMQDNQ